MGENKHTYREGPFGKVQCPSCCATRHGKWPLKHEQTCDLAPGDAVEVEIGDPVVVTATTADLERNRQNLLNAAPAYPGRGLNRDID